jgi:MYXO-CTERM domain-containing protein
VTIGVLTPTFAPRAGERAEIELRFTDRTGVARVHAEIRRADGGAVAVLDDETLRTPGALAHHPRGVDRRPRRHPASSSRRGPSASSPRVTDVAGRTASAEGSITLTEAPVRADGGVGTARTGTDHGCGCGVPGPRPSPAPLGLLALGLLRRRRRRHVG